MVNAALVTFAFAVHPATLVGSLAAFYKYGDRSEAFQKSLQGTDGLRTRLNTAIAYALGATLAPVFRDAGTEPTLLLDRSRTLSYQEVPINVVGSEAYRNAIRDFVEERASLLSDYNLLRSARDRWCGWATRLSWSILFLLSWQALACVGLALCRLALVKVPDLLIYGSLVPTTALILGSITCLFPQMRSHDAIMKIRAKYDFV